MRRSPAGPPSRPVGTTRAASLGGARLGGLTRLLPARLTGPGRRPAWQRTRLRRALSAALVAGAVWLAMSALRPPAAAGGVPIVVVARDLMPGHVLTLPDLAVAEWPQELSPDGTVSDPAVLVGESLGAGMSRGEPVTAARVRGPGLLAGARAGLVAAHVRVADPAMATMASPGDRVDLMSSAGKLVAQDVTVLAVDGGAAANTGWSSGQGAGPPGGVIVAVTQDAALRLATVDPSGLADATFSLVMRAPAP